MNAWSAGELAEFLGAVEGSRHRPAWLLLGIRADRDTLVFCHPDGRLYNPGRFSREFDRAIERAGLRRIRLHDFRHSHASIALAEGVNVNVVSQRLGHTKVSITQNTYQHLTGTMQSDAAKRIGAAGFRCRCDQVVTGTPSGALARGADVQVRPLKLCPGRGSNPHAPEGSRRV